MNTAPAGMIPPGVTVFCDPTLAAAMRAMDGLSRAQAGAPVSVLCAPATLMIAQIQRHTRNDVLFTLAGAMIQAVQLGLVRPESVVGGFSNTLVLAALQGGDPAALAKRVARARVAVTDDTVASGLDGRAVLAANGLRAANVMGAANTGDVAFMVTSGAAEIGLMYRTDAQADARLRVLATLNADTALVQYAAGVNAHAVSPNAQALLNVMRSAAGVAILQQAGIGIS